MVAQMVKNLPAMQETPVWSLGQEDPLEKEMATHTSIFAWRIPWTEEPGGPQFMGSQRVRHDWVTNTHSGISPSAHVTYPANPAKIGRNIAARLRTFGFISATKPHSFMQRIFHIQKNEWWHCWEGGLNWNAQHQGTCRVRNIAPSAWRPGSCWGVWFEPEESRQ